MVVPGVGAILGGLIPTLLNAVFGLIAGGVVMLVVSGISSVRARFKA